MTPGRAQVPNPAGIPAGLIEVVLEIVRGSTGPVRRRPLLEELARRGRVVSLAGLNRLLDYTRRAGLTVESEAGVAALPPR